MSSFPQYIEEILPENSTYIDKELAGELTRIAHRQAERWIKTLDEAISSGSINPDQKVNLVLPIENIDITRFSLLGRLTMQFGTPKAALVSNSAIVGLGLYSGGTSIIGYGATTDPKAKTCYGISAIFSASAVTNGGIAIIARACQISEVAALSEAIGMSFMVLGNKAHRLALELEGKPLPPHLSRAAKPPLFPGVAGSGLSFITPSRYPSLAGIIEQIPFQQVGRVVGGVLTVYAYGKIVIVCYRHGQKLLSNFQKKRKLNRTKKQAEFIIMAIQASPSYTEYRRKVFLSLLTKKLCLIS